MYQLRVIARGSLVPIEILSIERASEVLSSIPQLLARHGDCERIEVLARTTPLFAVDCRGQPLQG
ncbi:hypothetical protein ACO2Q0_19700 [Phenylobacterium sp. VNQ135]|uniref:hypothetical protein n=1 Tax=Phenylobacterium sp. VNQ135 TaxID=3400922 RepID=UPI003BFEDC3B